ncbi:hypothetical protein U3516DRAFT_839593 [Neocallimastix sp. 'constans']
MITLNTNTVRKWIYNESSGVEINKCTNSISFKYFSENGVIFSPKFDGKSAKTNNSVYYRVCNQSEEQKWSLWNRNPSGSSNSKTLGLNINDRPTAFECRNWNRHQWEIPVSGHGFLTNIKEGWCLHVNDINSDEESNIVMGKCDGNAVIKDISSIYNGKSIISILGENKCLNSINLMDPTTTDLKLNICNKNNDFQHWEIRTTIRDCDSNTALDYTEDGTFYSIDIGDRKCMSASNSSSNINLKTYNKSDEQIWSVWDRNPYEITRLKTHTKVKSEIPISGDGFFKSLSKGYCLFVINNNRGTIVMRQCNNNVIIKDIKTSFNKESIMSPLNSKKGLGLLESKGIKLNMNTCDNSKNDQYWEICTKNPASN